MIEIRRLHPGDAQALWELRMESLREAPLAFGEHHTEHALVSADAIAARLALTESFVYGAFDGPGLVGMAGFYRSTQKNRRHTGHIWGVYVQGSYRGQGLSRRLVATLIAEARKLSGVELVLLSVTQPEARALYVNLGFQAYGYLTHALIVDGQSVNEELMSLSL